ncbi:winged helix-turn-helix domain-containing protein [Nocardioides sp. KC13]|uniref:Winged helix-turn-helix domain-containing protein n=1 Tax=Nocardioides turkmenicus TaxID=2711220 RepID=A0A6M1RHF1_9ACTN|nr:winged helix-turn-helix domain-containing protein [Nocardioides sp. KC13]
MPRSQTLSRSQARRIALAAQGFADKPHTTPTMRTFQRTLERTGVLQVDSVNVLQRAHYMPLYSRMGAYDTGLLHRASRGRRDRRMVEYWAHVQAFMPVELWPHMQWRMDDYRAQKGSKWWGSVPDGMKEKVLALVAEQGALTAREAAKALDDAGPQTKDHWGWNWSDSRKTLDILYMFGELAISHRNDQFEVAYDLPERVIPRVHLDAPTPSREEAHLELVRRATRSHGVGTAKDIADYFRMRVDDTTRALNQLIDAGEVEPVAVEGIRKQAYLYSGSRLPRRIDARALLSPFDPLVWERERTEALFDFFYRIEIYTPAPKRIHGYYVLPFLLGEHIVGRVDLKADRKNRTLQVKGAFAEPHAPAETPVELAAELERLAGWLGMDTIQVEPKGDLAPALITEVVR